MNKRNIAFVYLVLLGLSSAHLYLKPIYNMDSVQYIGNALLMQRRDIVAVHDEVYRDLRRSVPTGPLQDILGNRPGEPPDQALSRQVRASDPYRFAEFLPLFAIRPLYVQMLWLTSRLGFGLVQSAILVSVISYFLIGVVLFSWITRYTNAVIGLVLATLLMMSPPLTDLGRDLTSDAAATLVAFGSLYLIFEKRRIAAGLALLLVSIYFRTDFVVLAGPALLACWLDHQIDLWKGAVLSALAVGSVLMINHFAGDYGIKMLYYRNFLGTPIAPGEMIVQFTFRDYLSAFRSGVRLALGSYLIPFSLLGVIGIAGRRMRTLFWVALAYVGLHFLILPNWQERWVGIFYLCCGVCAAATLSRAQREVPLSDTTTLAA
jgi:hypothetical protein